MPRKRAQPRLPGLGAASRPPAGFRYEAGFLTPDEEARLVESFADLPFQHFEFRGFLGRRRVVSYGWRYSFGERALLPAGPLPPFLVRLRERAAVFAGVPAESLQQSSVIEYSAGTTIGWHRDKAVFGDVMGISLLTPCVFRMRRKAGAAWERCSLALEPRSAYVMRGEARNDWEHSIPPVPALRYSVTFRTLR